MCNITNPKPGEPVRFDVDGKTHGGHISVVYPNGNFLVDPDIRMNEATKLENIRRPESKVPELTDIEKLAVKVKNDGRYAGILRQENPTKYKEVMEVLLSGKLRCVSN